jgi:hypothetical protein
MRLYFAFRYIYWGLSSEMRPSLMDMGFGSPVMELRAHPHSTGPWAGVRQRGNEGEKHRDQKSQLHRSNPVHRLPEIGPLRITFRAASIGRAEIEVGFNFRILAYRGNRIRSIPRRWHLQTNLGPGKIIGERYGIVY